MRTKRPTGHQGSDPVADLRPMIHEARRAGSSTLYVDEDLFDRVASALGWRGANISGLQTSGVTVRPLQIVA